MVSPAVEAIERARRNGRRAVWASDATRTAQIADVASDAACRELLGYLREIAQATDLDGVLAEIDALECAIGGE